MGLSSSVLVKQLNSWLGCSPGNSSCSFLVRGVAISATACYVILDSRCCLSRGFREAGVRKEIFSTAFISLDVEFTSWCISMCKYRDVSGVSAMGGAAASPAGIVTGHGRSLPGAFRICKVSGRLDLKNVKM